MEFAAGTGMPQATAAAIAGGRNRSPGLALGPRVPAGTGSYALAMVDTTPPGAGFVHWLVADIPLPRGAAGDAAAPPSVTLPTGASVASRANAIDSMPPGSIELRNDAGSIGYFGPSPPAGTHTYRFVLYAMPAEKTGLTPEDGKEAFFAVVSKALGYAAFEGTYKR